MINVNKKRKMNILKLNKLSILFFAITIFIMFSSISQNKDRQISYDYSENTISLSYNELKSNNYWNLINSSIFIDDADPKYNWSKTAAENDWCTGSGTLNDPYLIENVTIDAYFISSGIKIRNSQKFFRVQNCSVYNSGSGTWDSGISLENTSNGQILNCQFLNHNFNSILVRNCLNITIMKNRVENSPMGIRLLDSNNSVIDENSIFGISQQGIALIRSFENLVSNNKIRHSFDYSMFLVDSSNNTISGNLIGGIYLWQPNLYGYIMIWNSHINVITENIFIHIDIALVLDSSSNNLIYKNYFNSYGNIPCIDHELNNDWDNGSMGNYWSNYYGNDNNHDGIGDSIHDFGTGTDRYPIWREGPSVNVFSPQNGETYTNPPNFNIEIARGTNIDSIYYTLNFTDIRYLVTDFSGAIDTDAWFALPNGPLFIVFSINDTFGLQKNIAIYIIKNPIPPPFDPMPIIISSIITLLLVVLLGLFVRKKLALKLIDKNVQFKIKKSVLTFGKKGGRLEIKEISEETKESKRVVIPVVKKMIEEHEIDADYFKSSKSIVYNRKTVSNEIDMLINEFKEWEEEKKEQ